MLEKYKLVLCLYIATQLKIFSVIRRCPTWWCFCLILNIIWIRNAFHDVVGVEFISIYMYMYISINLRVFCLGARIMYELDPTPEVQKKSLEIATSLSESYTGITRLVIKHFLSYLKYFYKISPFLDKRNLVLQLKFYWISIWNCRTVLRYWRRFVGEILDLVCQWLRTTRQSVTDCSLCVPPSSSRQIVIRIRSLPTAHSRLVLLRLSHCEQARCHVIETVSICLWLHYLWNSGSP